MGPIVTPFRLTRTLLAAACLAVVVFHAAAQTSSAAENQAPPPTQPPMLSPRAAYDEAMRPLDITRRDAGNWSDVEVAALALAVQQAGSACALRDPLHVPVDDLVDLARLCGVGQKWEVTMLAAHRYIADPQPTKPQLTQAYADAVEAELRLKMGSAALRTAQDMLAKVPYDAIVSSAYNQALEYLQFSEPHDALTLAQAAQPLLLAFLKSIPPATPASGTTAPTAAPATEATLTPTQAYRDALRLAALEVYLGHLNNAATLAAAVESALPTALGGDDTLLIAAERRRFALLGQRLPLVDVALSLDPQRAPAQELPLSGLTTALLLFPDWCAQCVRMGPQFPEGKFTVAGRAAAFYALLAQTRPSSKPPALQPAGTPTPRTALDQLRGTPTLLVPAATLLQLEASDYPLLVLVDEKGIVRLHQPVGEDALQAGSTLDTAIASLGAVRTPAKPAPERLRNSPPAPERIPVPGVRPGGGR